MLIVNIVTDRLTSLNKASYVFLSSSNKLAFSAESAFYHPAKSGNSDREYFHHCHTIQRYCQVDVKFEMMPRGTSS